MQKLTSLFSDSDFLAEVPCEEVAYPAGAVILDEGDEGRDLFLITQGEVEVSYNLSGDVSEQPARLTHLKVGDIFGELSLFDSGPRSAVVKAIAECKMFKVEGPTLIAYLDANPTKGYFVLRELFMHLVVHMRQNNLRTKMALQMYFLEHSDN